MGRIFHNLYAIPVEVDVTLTHASVSQQITRLLGTDDWATLHSGHEMVTDVQLDEIEAAEHLNGNNDA